ncbi:MAG: alpha/beta hydrolase-fold protein [Imperialibacter sp.]|uniref:alpha/beta hydrolase n=1 Tax=Imperialibacter sp. TaxID=2038411 RepID=UPI0032EAACA0
MKRLIGSILCVVYLVASGTSAKGQAAKQGSLKTETLASEILKDNLIGLDPNRMVKVYLPPGYTNSKKAYPVVYYLHNAFSNVDAAFQDGNLLKLVDRAFASNVVHEFILVAADYSSPTTGSMYENSTTSGRWLDFTVNELVPFIDGKFRTLSSRDSRAVVGHFFGGRGALKLAMTHAEVFSVAYAMHPVATGNGDLPWANLDIDWSKIKDAQTFQELAGLGRTQIFVAISQGFLPNPNRPPFYCDFFVDFENGQPKLNPEMVSRAKKEFHLEETLEESAANLRSMRGIAFDWGRFDQTQAHVISSRTLSRKLIDYGVEHEAEEYNGDPWSKIWIDDGRFYTRVLPFLGRKLVFE